MLNNRIKNYFFRNFASLRPKHQFHFVSRLYLWNQDPVSKVLVDKSYKAYFGDLDRQSFKDHLQKLYFGNASQPSNKNLYSQKDILRKPYRQRFSPLNKINQILFRISFARTIFQKDYSKMFYEIADQTSVVLLKKRLLKDPEAIATLSTSAINFLYLHANLFNLETGLNYEYLKFLIKNHYDYTNSLHLKNIIYLITHCIIGESEFYYKPIKSKRQKEFQQLLSLAESIIEANFQKISIDAKVEFLVTSQIVNYKTYLQERINIEVSESISPYGTFIDDSLIQNQNNESFNRSEHRNVLYLMSCARWTPLGSNN